MSTKKKLYSDIACGKACRAIEFWRRRNKALHEKSQDKYPADLFRLVGEYADVAAEYHVLDAYAYAQTDGKSARTESEDMKARSADERKAIKDELKARLALMKALARRLDLAGVTPPGDVE